MPIRVFTDAYKLNKKHYDQMSVMTGDMEGEGPIPVDINGAAVNLDKNNPHNLEETQESLNWRFNARGPSHHDEVDPMHETTVIYGNGKTEKEGGEG